MSRRSSYGYPSYGSHQYRPGGYHSKNKQHNIKSIVIAVILVIVLLMCAASVFFFAILPLISHSTSGNKTNQDKLPVTAQESSLAEQQNVQPSGQETPSSVSESSGNAKTEGYFDSNVFIWDHQGYEMFYGTTRSASSYADTVSSIKQKLGKNIAVYNMVIPTHGEFVLPQKYLDNCSDQKENLKTIRSSCEKSGIISIDVYESLKAHSDEYTYFKTDSNWTALGAYYSYLEFCKAANVKEIGIEKLTKGSINNFQGSLMSATKTDSDKKGNKELLANPDTVVYYNIPIDYSCILMEKGKTDEQEVPMIATFAEGSNAYSAFIWGDNPYMKITVPGNKTGRKLCIIKDSYGCAFVPFTAASFDEIYIIDPRYYIGNIIDYIKKNKYTDVLVINSIMSANTDIRIDELRSVIS